MRLVLAAATAASLLPALPGLAQASPDTTPLARRSRITAGLTAGMAQSKQDADGGADANHTIGLFGRLGFTPRLAGQLEISRIQTDNYSNVNLRSATALLVVDLGSKGRLVPILLAGFGLDDASTEYGSSTGAHHIEGGLGLEYRSASGVTIGADVRLGGRTLHYDDVPLTGGCSSCTWEGRSAPEDDAGKPVDQVLFAPATSLRDGEYRTARITVGIAF